MASPKKQTTISDAGAGRAMLLTSVRLSFGAGLMSLGVGLAGFIAPYALWLHDAPAFDIDVIRFDMVSSWVSEHTPLRWRFRHGSDEREMVTLVTETGEEKQWLTSHQVRRVMSSFVQPRQNFGRVKLTSLLLATAGFLGTWGFLAWYGRGSQENRRIRGAKLIITARELDRAVRRKSTVRYSLVDVALPARAPMAGLLLLGAQGSGKSLAFHDLIGQAIRAEKKCIILDQSGEFYQAHFRPGKDVIFNPAMLGSVCWSIFSEIEEDYNAPTLAEAFLPSKGGGGDTGAGSFFENAARALFTTLLRRLKEAGAKNTRDIADAILNMPAEEMAHLIKGSVASSAMGGDSKQQRQGVISSIAIYLDGLAAVQPGNWSMKEFIDGPQDMCLYILGSDDTRDMFSPLYRLLITVAFSAIAARREKTFEDRYWFFLDEMNTLGDLKIDSHLATVRKNGVCVVSGVQSESQLASSMDKNRQATASNCFNTVMILRTNDPVMQESAAKRLGKVEMDTVTRSQALAVDERRDGAGLNRSEGEKWLVMPTDLGMLAPCRGYMKLFGDYPVATVDYSHWAPEGGATTCRANDFAPVRDLPPMDPRFKLQVKTTDDALGSIKEDFDQHQAREEAEKKSAEDAARKAAQPINRPRGTKTSTAPASNVIPLIPLIQTTSPRQSTPTLANAPAAATTKQGVIDIVSITKPPAPEARALEGQSVRPSSRYELLNGSLKPASTDGLNPNTSPGPGLGQPILALAGRRASTIEPQSIPPGDDDTDDENGSERSPGFATPLQFPSFGHSVSQETQQDAADQAEDLHPDHPDLVETAEHASTAAHVNGQQTSLLNPGQMLNNDGDSLELGL